MVRPLTDPELVDLLVECRSRNADRGITGLLLYRQGRVLQMLEGDELVVRNLYDRIRMDVRHEHVTNVWAGTASGRRFPDWSMGFEDLDGVRRSVSTGAALADGLVDGEATAEQQDYLRRRTAVLRRALASGDRLVGALAVILNGHDPERSGAETGRPVLRCRACRPAGAPGLDAYPCPTAKNALWALEAAGPR